MQVVLWCAKTAANNLHCFKINVLTQKKKCFHWLDLRSLLRLYMDLTFLFYYFYGFTRKRFQRPYFSWINGSLHHKTGIINCHPFSLFLTIPILIPNGGGDTYPPPPWALRFFSWSKVYSGNTLSQPRADILMAFVSFTR